jgi:hypothetical protein
MLGHPRWQQKPAATRLLNHEVGAIRIAESPQNHDALAGARVMRISDDNFKQLLLGSMSPVRRARSAVGATTARPHTRGLVEWP